MSDELRELLAKAKVAAATASVTWSQKASRHLSLTPALASGPAPALASSLTPALASGPAPALGLSVVPTGPSIVRPGLSVVPALAAIDHGGLAAAVALSPDAPSDLAIERWGLDVLRGRLVEISARGAAATLTTAIDLILEAQETTEPVAWVSFGDATFYPPDVAARGVDLEALAVIRTHDVAGAARAAERLLRSGGFGLVFLDFAGSSSANDLSIPHQGRLVTLAQTHDAAVVCITNKPCEAPSLGSLISLRAEALRTFAPESTTESVISSGYCVTLRALKDKRRGPGWTHSITRQYGPDGA